MRLSLLFSFPWWILLIDKRPKFESMPWYSFKEQARNYLAEINKEKKVLEYCLFQPGLFTNYLTYPHKSANHLTPIETPFDFGGRRMIVYAGDLGQKMTFTTVQDLAGVVVRAVEYEGVWPVVGGIKGSDLSLGEIVALGEELRGKPTPVSFIFKAPEHLADAI